MDKKDLCSNKNFVHFHVHSSYSLFDGLAKLWDLVMQARRMEFPAIALTDHGNIGGWIKFLQYAKASYDKKGNPIEYPPIKPILGSEFYVSRKADLKDKESQPEGRRGNRHLNLYAMNWEGYKNVSTLSQMSYTEGFYYDPRIDIEMLAKHSKGVMCGTACLSSIVNANLLHSDGKRYDGYKKAKYAVEVLKDIFEENLFLEVMYHGLDEERVIMSDIFKLSKSMKVPVLATNDVHYIKKAQAPFQELFMCMSSGKCIKDTKHIRFPYSEFYLKSAEEMYKMFSSHPEVLTNTVAIADKVDTKSIEDNLFIHGIRLPEYEIPEKFNNSQEYIEHLAWEGMKKLGWDKSEKHIDRLKMELEDIKVAKENNNLDFATYFLIVRDYVTWVQENGWLTGAGRGSGYASVLLRCLGITYGVDPIEHQLLWERFLGFDTLYFVSETDFGFKG